MIRSLIPLCLLLAACGSTDDPGDDGDAGTHTTVDGGGDGTTDAGSTQLADAEVLLISDLSTTASYFTYDAPSAEVHWFAVLDADGVPHVAFDACEVCYGAGLGYDQSGETMVCNNCGNVFDIEAIGTENQGGGCWPGYLPVELTDTQVIVAHEDLEAGAWYFE